MKWAWYRYVPGRLTIDGRRLDAPASPLRADVPDGYGDSGFQVSGITFPTAGVYVFAERLRPLHAVGMVLILAGVACLLSGD